MIEVPKQNHKVSISKLAQKYGLSARTIRRDLRDLGASKSREQYEKDAQTRRRIAYELRQSGLKWAEVADKMGLSLANAKMLGTRYKQSLNATA